MTLSKYTLIFFNKQLESGPSPQSCLNFLLFSIVKDNNSLLYSIVIFEKSEPWLLIDSLLIKKKMSVKIHRNILRHRSMLQPAQTV